MVHFLPQDLNPIEESCFKLKSVMKANEQLLESGLDVEALVLAGFLVLLLMTVKHGLIMQGRESKTIIIMQLL